MRKKTQINLFDFPIYFFMLFYGKERKPRDHHLRERQFITLPVPASVIIGSWFSMAEEESKDAPQNGKRSKNV